MIKCEICGQEVHSIKHHLKDAHHPESVTPMTFEQYTENYPTAPIFSEEALSRMAQKKKEAKKDTKAETPKSDPSKSTAPMAKLFGLGRIKAAKRSDGKDIEVTVLDRSKQTGFIPDMDSNYVHNVDKLKSALLGMEMGIPTYVYGHAGLGKSSLYEQICGATNRSMVRVQHTINTEESHIVGQWTVVNEKDEDSGEMVQKTKFELGPLPLAMINGWVYLADEYDRAYPSVLSVYQAVLEGKSLYIKEADEANRLIRPHKNFRFVATGNTNGAGDETGLYQATVVQDAATFERFGIVEKLEYMGKKEETAIIKGQAGLKADDAAKIVDYCHRVREQFPKSISLTIGPRAAVNVAKVGLLRGSFLKGVELAFANRLPESEREAAIEVAKRVFSK